MFAMSAWDEPVNYFAHPTEKEEEQAERLEMSSDFLKGVLDQLYGKEPFDEHMLEFRLEELCGFLNVTLPRTPLRVQRI